MTDGDQPDTQKDEQSGWLPPSAPGSAEPPQFGQAPPPPQQVEGLPPSNTPIAGIPQAPPPAQPYGAPPAYPAPQYPPPPAPGAYPAPGGVQQPPPPGQPPAPYGWPQQPQPGWYQPAPARPSNGSAVAALVLGIAGILITFFFAGFLFFVSLPCSIAAWVLGVKGKKLATPNPELEPTKPAGRGMAQAGLICGIVGIVLAILAIVFWVLLFTLGDFDVNDYETAPSDDLFESAVVLVRAVTILFL